MFTPRFLTPEQVNATYLDALQQIEQRLLLGHINHVIDADRQGHYAAVGAHEEGSAVIERLLVDFEQVLARRSGGEIAQPEPEALDLSGLFVDADPEEGDDANA
jgi:hypothetical protein